MKLEDLEGWYGMVGMRRQPSHPRGLVRLDSSNK